MQITCTLFGDYRDIRLLRKIKGYSIKELADMIYRTESYVTQIENNKINLTVENYNLILNSLGFNKIVKTTFSVEDIQKQICTKGKMYMKNSNIEIAKQIILNHIEKRRDEWCIEGISACMKLIEIMNKKNPKVLIKNDNYPVYDGSDCGNYDLVGEEYTLDIPKLAEKIIEDSEHILDNTWAVPTIEGPWLDIYSLL